MVVVLLMAKHYSFFSAFLSKGARGFPGTPGLPGFKGIRVSTFFTYMIIFCVGKQLLVFKLLADTSWLPHSCCLPKGTMSSGKIT
jgi:hypothetical protein